MKDQLKVDFNGHELTFARARFGKFMEGESVYEQFFEAKKRNDSGGVASAIIEYIEIVSSITREELLEQPWFEVVKIFIELKAFNQLPDEIPILSLRAAAPEIEKLAPWDYKGRGWFVWVHMLAASYGWTRAEILELLPIDVAKHIQEIIVDGQLEKEWMHSLSEVAYPRDAKGKATFTPLPRPVWMRASGKPRKVRLRRDALPQGIVEDLSGVKDSDQEELSSNGRKN